MRINLDWVSNALPGKKMKGKKAMRINLDWVSNALSGKK